MRLLRKAEREIIPDWQESSGTVATRLRLAFIESGAGAEWPERQWNHSVVQLSTLRVELLLLELLQNKGFM